jgi:outer membrane protein OmpA-like peptidoglycan-associated protein
MGSSTVSATRPSWKFMLVGHADRLASNAYNRRLSCRRALVVKKRLVTDGIEPRLLKVACLGESEPQVETADEIGEPMNRRVKIVVKTALPH